MGIEDPSLACVWSNWTLAFSRTFIAGTQSKVCASTEYGHAKYSCKKRGKWSVEAQTVLDVQDLGLIWHDCMAKEFESWYPFHLSPWVVKAHCP
jgi:hypothetical protein